MKIYGLLFIHTFISLFSIVNPIGCAPIFLEVTRGYSHRERNKIAYQVMIYGIILLIVTLFIGPSMLKFFGLSLPLIQIAGGFLVFFTSWEMLNFKSKINPSEQQEAMKREDVAFFPLTMPITAGAGSMAIIIATASRLEHSISTMAMMQYGMVIAAIVGVLVIAGLCYRFSGAIFTWLGQTGTSTVTRLFAFILLAIGVGLMWEGISNLVLSLHTTGI